MKAKERNICPKQTQKRVTISELEHIPFSFVISNVKPQTGIVCDIDTSSVADPGCLSRILIFPHPRSRIQTQQQKRGVKKNLLSYLFL
jgi:hypothetical protein